MTRRSRRPAQLARLYREISQLPREAQLAPLGEAIALAQEAGDEIALYELRCLLIEAANWVDDAETEVAAFSWVLEKHLSDPDRFELIVTQPNYVDVAWVFKWVLNTLMKNSAISRSQIEDSLASMDDLYRRNGLGESAPTLYRLSAAEYLGDVAELPVLLERLEATPRDSHSDCEACTPHWLVTADLMLGQNQRAFERGKQALAEGETCLTEPHEMLAELVLPLLLEGETATAEDYFRRCLDKTWGGASERMTATGDLLAAAAISGNIALGLDRLERCLPDLAKVLHDHRSRLGFLSGAALLLERSSAAGLGSRPVRDTIGVLESQSISSGTRVAELIPGFWAEATRLATAFDARAGNRWWQGWLDARRELVTVSIPLDLGFDEPEPFAEVAIVAPATAQEWCDYADERNWIGDTEGALLGVEQALRCGGLEGEQLVDALGARTRRLVTLAQERAGVATSAELPAQDRTRFEEADQAYRRELETQGMTDQLKIVDALGTERYDRGWDPDPEAMIAQMARLRADGVPEAKLYPLEHLVASGLIERERGDEALPYLLAARDHRLTEGGLRLAAATHLATAQLLGVLDNPGVVDELEAALSDSGGSRSIRAAALRHRAYLHAQAGEWSAGEQAAREAGHLYLALDGTAQAAEVIGLQAAMAEEADDLARAISLTRRAIGISERSETFDPAELRTALGRRLVMAGQPEQAVSVLMDLDQILLARNEQEGSPASYDCAFWLGTALQESDDPNRAVGVWGAALEVAKSRDDASAMLVFGRAVGDIFARYSMWDEALEAFGAAKAAASDLGELAGLGERIGLIKCLSGDAGGLEDLDAAIASARELEAPLAVADWTDSRARALAALGRTDEAIAAALASSDLFAEADERAGWAQGLELAAQLLADAGRAQEAITLLKSATTEDDPQPEVVRLRRMLDELTG